MYSEEEYDEREVPREKLLAENKRESKELIEKQFAIRRNNSKSDEVYMGMVDLLIVVSFSYCHYIISDKKAESRRRKAVLCMCCRQY